MATKVFFFIIAQSHPNERTQDFPSCDGNDNEDTLCENFHTLTSPSWRTS